MLRGSPRCARVRWVLALAASVITAPVLAEKKAPNTAKDQLRFGVKMAADGLWSEALFRFQQAERQAPEDPVVLNNLAIAHEALGLFDEALGLYRRALEIDANQRIVRRNYARFVEFYQSFKPDAVPDDAAALGAPTPAGKTPAPPAETPPLPGPPGGPVR